MGGKTAVHGMDLGVLMVGSGMGEMLHRPGHWCASQHPPTGTSATKTSIGVCIIMSPLAPFPLSVALQRPGRLSVLLPLTFFLFLEPHGFICYCNILRTDRSLAFNDRHGSRVEGIGDFN